MIAKSSQIFSSFVLPILTCLAGILFTTFVVDFNMYAKYAKQQSSGMSDSDEHFECLYSGQAHGGIPVFKYRSSKTGLTVVLAQVEGPLVNGYFCLATEAHDDDGLPHTLEHLIFMGSEKYPFKGVLDLLANRCLASGTNAWTDTDHTCYTMTTAGTEGFLNLMPIYLDHVLYPTLTESAYVTEVHHVDGAGEDAGVVYCEMQARENTGESLTHLEMLRSSFPGHCGYKSETGGLLENLRTSTSHKKVQDYHKEFYRPENLCLIVTGQVEPKQLFASIKPFEEKIVGKGPLPEHVRPWQSEVPTLTDSVDKVVKFPSDDEDNGMVRVAWRGPNAKDQAVTTAVLILMEYLTDTAVAPLQRDFVEIDDPFCSRVSYSIIENSETCVYITFQNVPVKKLGEVKVKLMNLLSNLESGTEKFDMNRMGSVIHRRVLEAMNSLEDQPHDTLAFFAIGDFLYGNVKDDFDQRLNQITTFKKLTKEPAEYWTKLLTTYFVNKNYVTIVGEPSKELMEKSGAEEKKGIKKQAEALGKDGLQKKSDRLQKATEDNEMEPPVDMLTSVPVPDVGSIHFHTIDRSSNLDPNQANINEKFPLADLPLAVQLDDIKTNFVTMTVMMDTSSLSKEQRLYLPLLLEVILESPIMRNGTVISHEEVITELAADTLDNSAGLGVDGRKFNCGQFSQLAHLELKVEMEKYEKGVNWLRELLYQTQFTGERLKIVATKMSNDVAQMKRNGRQISQMLKKSIIFNQDSNHHLSSMLRQHKFLASVIKKLESPEETEKLISDMNAVRDVLVRASSLRVHLATHVNALSAFTPPLSPWQQNFKTPNEDTDGSRPVIGNEQQFLFKADEGPTTGVIAGVGSVESAFLIQSTPSINQHLDQDLAALMVYIQYLTQLEGPMWRQIRGLGLSYHYSMYIKPDNGLLYFILFKSSQLVSAYKQAKEIIDGLMGDSAAFNEVEFDAAKSSLVFEIIEEEKTPADASSQSLLSHLRELDGDYNRKLIEAIPKVTIDDLKKIGTKYIAPLFDSKTSKVAICCHPTKVEEVVSGFKEMSRELTVIKDLDDSYLSEL